MYRPCLHCEGKRYDENICPEICTYGEAKKRLKELEKSFPVPCIAGDTAYMITTNGDIKNLTVTHINISLSKNEIEIICRAVFDMDGCPCEITIVPSKIGEIYFFSLADAETALNKLKKKVKNKE